METVLPELMELKKQMHKEEAAKRKQYRVDARMQYLATQNTLLDEKARLLDERAKILNEFTKALDERAKLLDEKAKMLDENALLRRQLMEK